MSSEAWNAVAKLQQWESASPLELGPHTAHQYRNDPKHLLFVLARYKFVAKILAGQKRVLEIGCGDAFGTPIVAQVVGRLYATDQDERLLKDAEKRLAFVENCLFLPTLDDFTQRRMNGVYAIDVLEHVEHEAAFMRTLVRALRPYGMAILGTPNATAAPYASASSQVGHVNLKDFAGLHRLMSQYFRTVLMLGMNDELVHTGYAAMCHYLWAVGIGPK